MWRKTTLKGPWIIGSLSLFIGMAMGLAACGDAGNSTGSAVPPTEAQGTTTTVAEKPTGEPTEFAPDGWMTFTSEADAFAVDMPGDPQTSTQSMDSALGELTFHFFQLTDGRAHYALSYNDYPAEVTVDDLDSESILNDAVAATAQGGELKNVQLIEVQGYPGIEGEASLQGAAYVWYRSILVGNRLYQLVMVAPEADKDEFADEGARFIDSFTLLTR